MPVTMHLSHLLALVLVLFTIDAGRTATSASTALTPECQAKGCSHGCETEGEVSNCVCPQDMSLDTDAKHCRDSTFFLYTIFRSVSLFNVDLHKSVIVTPGSFRALDFHYARKDVFAYTNYSIMRYPIFSGNTTSPGNKVVDTETSVTSLAVDWVHDVIYYISEQQSALSVTSLDGTGQRTILTRNDSVGWRHVVVDPYVKKLFWIGSEGVYAYNLESGELVKNIISWLDAEHIALDTRNQLVYAIGRKEGRPTRYVTTARYNGTRDGEDVEVLEPANKEVYGFGVVGTTVYWHSNQHGESVYKVDIQAARQIKLERLTLVVTLDEVVYDLKVFHKGVQWTAS